ncbi:MAG: sugar transferase related protein [Microgenomates bacterium 39_6]|nr:MAG: sugar transferase related protein [Microgenomates bacterium 39_6]
MKISFITTTLNEEKSIDSFLSSIAKQTQKPEEIIIVDAGSTDQTVKKIKTYQKKLPIKLIVESGVNRSRGRNIAIKQARGEIIAVSDAGCILDPNWLKEITSPLKKKNVSVVAGSYQPIAKTPFQKCLAFYTCADVYQKNKNRFLPSSRSIAFKKNVWKKVGGYPKNLNYCEDLVFDQKLKRAKYYFHFAPKAVVYWPQRKTPKQAFRQFYNYAFGDGRVFFSPLQTHSVKISLIFLRYLIGLIIFGLAIKYPIWRPIFAFIFFAYLAWPIIKTRKNLSGSALFLSPLMQLLSDFAVMLGATRGILENIKKKV